MSDVLQIKAGQRGKVLSFATGVDISAAFAITVRVRREDGAILNEYVGTPSPTDPTAIELTIAAGMFDAPETVNVDYIAVMPDGRKLAFDDNIPIEVIDL